MRLYSSRGRESEYREWNLLVFLFSEHIYYRKQKPAQVSTEKTSPSRASLLSTRELSPEPDDGALPIKYFWGVVCGDEILLSGSGLGEEDEEDE